MRMAPTRMGMKGQTAALKSRLSWRPAK
jgi:hypothetical protein